MKQPDECTTLADVRAEIDAIDEQVIALLGKRAAYVRAAAQFKTSATDVHAADRQVQMIAQRRVWAEQQRLDPDVVEAIYRTLVQYFIREEMHRWESRS